ncbi:ABC transporter substrate-binding protein [Bdellovibrio bacteriovorus]|uniref:ferreportin n=1 Tax=Bdellovibrio bacteriovorus TaxID=959 RepID=UPI0035A62D44
MSMKVQNLFRIETQLLLGRLLTRSGDQAWDFVVPFALLVIFPGKLQVAAFYYLIVKIGTFVLTPSSGKWIDTQSRSLVVKWGVWLQFFAILMGMVFFGILDSVARNADGASGLTAVLFFALAFSGMMASLGSQITDISVGNDLAPSLVAPEKLTQFNSWLRRIDLATEVGAPIVAGILFAFHPAQLPLAGLFLIGLWNLVSFVPEYFLLRNVIQKSGLRVKVLAEVQSWKETFHINLRSSFGDPIFWLVLSYALLWLSVLSPHGVLLAAYLKDEMSLPEAEIGLFRGLGAVFGLISTVSFPYLVRRLGLITSSRWHLGFQGLTLTIGIIAFAMESGASVYVFLGCILLSRVGLYGFSNGEFELRQRLIPEGRRGELNSLSSLTTTSATLILFAAGSLLPQTEDFKYLVYASLAAALLANLVFIRWSSRHGVAPSRPAEPADYLT